MSNAYEELRAMAAKCTFCGSCHAVCPVFDKLAKESACSRGRLFQARFLSEERIKADKHPAFAVHWLYWHLPTSPLTAMRATPPSHIRRMVG